MHVLKIWVNEKKKGKTFGLKLFNSIPPINQALFTRIRKFLKPHIVLYKTAFHSQGNHAVNPLTALDSSDLSCRNPIFLKVLSQTFFVLFFFQIRRICELSCRRLKTHIYTSMTIKAPSTESWQTYDRYYFCPHEVGVVVSVQIQLSTRVRYCGLNFLLNFQFSFPSSSIVSQACLYVAPLGTCKPWTNPSLRSMAVLSGALVLIKAASPGGWFLNAPGLISSRFHCPRPPQLVYAPHLNCHAKHARRSQNRLARLRLEAVLHSLGSNQTLPQSAQDLAYF